jgi:toxin-antitoxin system PIN domain toxin
LDANLWLALAHERHTHHNRARRYWESEGFPVAAMCRVTQMAFLRLLTNKTIMCDEVLQPADAWRKCQDFLALPEVQLLEEPAGLDDQWATFSDLGRTSQNLWTDAYLAAFARRAGLRLVTFDQGFMRFPGLETLILTPSAAAP